MNERELLDEIKEIEEIKRDIKELYEAIDLLTQDTKKLYEYIHANQIAIKELAKDVKKVLQK